MTGRHSRAPTDRTEIELLRAQIEERRSMDMLALVCIYAVLLCVAAVYADWMIDGGFAAEFITWAARVLHASA